MPHQYFNAGAEFEEKLDAGRVAHAGCGVERRLAEQHHAVGLGAAVEQQLHVPHGVDPDGGQEGGPAKLVQPEIDVGAVGEQEGEAVRVLNGSGAEERSGAV